tara:strand:- start:5696 stop:6175 length:480 start_codon:yes stop_codon:yes gene_type:complete
MLTIHNPKTFDWANMSLSDCCEGNAMDVYFTLKLYNKLVGMISDLGMKDVSEKVLMPSLEVFSRMERDGLLVSENVLKLVGKSLSDKKLDNEDSLYVYDAIKKTDNLSSNNDLIEILYTREGGMELYPPDKTAKGKPSVSAPTLKLLLDIIEKELVKRG